MAITSSRSLEQAESFLQEIVKSGIQDVSTLYAGSIGRCEILQVAAQALSRPDLLVAARHLAGQALLKVREKGCYQLFMNTTNPVFNPSFLHGTSGIGYGLLRLADPDVLPSLLLWE